MPPAIQIPRGLLPSGLASPYWRAGAGDSLTTQIKDGATSQINDVLQTAGFPPNEIQSAVQAYTGLDSASTDCIIGLVEGSIKPSFTALAPLIAAGLAATGVGAPVAAIVAAALPVLDALADAIFASPEQNCTWRIGRLCINNQKQPYGPGDPRWVTADQFFQTCVPAGWTIGQLGTSPPGPYVPGGPNPYAALEAIPFSGQGTNGCTSLYNDTIDAAFPYYRSTIDCDLRFLAGSPGLMTNPVWGFLYVYYHAWRVNAEFAINGYKSVPEDKLIQAVSDAWNRAHASSSTYTFGPVAPPAFRDCLNLYPSLSAHYPNLLCDADVTGVDIPPVVINTGPKASALARSPATGGSPVSTKIAASKPSGLAVAGMVTAGVAGASLLGVGAYALLTQQTYGAVLDKLARGLAKPFRR